MIKYATNKIIKNINYHEEKNNGNQLSKFNMRIVKAT